MTETITKNQFSLLLPQTDQPCLRFSFKKGKGNSLAVHWLGRMLSQQGKLRSHKPHGMAKIKKRFLSPIIKKAF